MERQEIEEGRKLEPHSLLDVLQQEYIICKLREIIYPFEHHKEYWRNTASMKKERILDLSKKIQIPNIFEDDRISQGCLDILINNRVIPKFYYSSNKIKDQQTYWDLFNWFAPGSKVTCRGKKGTILSIDMDTKKCIISTDNDGLMNDIFFEEIKRTDITIQIN